MTLDEVGELAMSLPEVTEGTSYGNRAWKVGGTSFVWERPFRTSDLRRFGDEPVPDGTIVGVRTVDLEDTAAVLASGTGGVFTIPHFDGYPAVLVQLSTVSSENLRELVVDRWLACEPAGPRDRYLAERHD